MTLNEFVQWTKDENGDKWKRSVDYNILGLTSEAGEVAGVRKRYIWADGDYRDYRGDILLELGDVLHYICRIADDNALSLQEIIDANVEKLTNRKKYGKGNKGKRS